MKYNNEESTGCDPIVYFFGGMLMIKNYNYFSNNLIFCFLILFVQIICFSNKCSALDSYTKLKINKSICLEISNSLMLSLNDSLLCSENLKQIDIVNETGNRYDNYYKNHNYETIKFDKNGILSEVNGDYINIYIEQEDTNHFNITYKKINGEVYYISLLEITELNIKISVKDYFLFFIPNNKVIYEAKFNENLDFLEIVDSNFELKFIYFDNYIISLYVNNNSKKLFSFSIDNNKTQSSISYSDDKYYIYETHDLKSTSLCFSNKDTAQFILKTTCYWNTLDFFNENLLNLKYENLKDSILLKSIFINLIDLFNTDKYLESNRYSLGQITWYEKKQFDNKGLLIDHFRHTSNYRTYKINYQYW